MSSGTVTEVTDTDFDDLLDADGTVVVDFWAPWCQPCKAFAPIFEEAAAKNPQVRFVKMNVDENPGTTAQMQIRSIPYLAVFRDGILVSERAGAVSAESISDTLSSVAELDMAAVAARFEPVDDA